MLFSLQTVFTGFSSEGTSLIRPSIIQPQKVFVNRISPLFFAPFVAIIRKETQRRRRLFSCVLLTDERFLMFYKRL